MVYKNLCIYCICRNEHTSKVNIFLLRKTSSIVVTIENIVNQAVTLTKFDYFYGHKKGLQYVDHMHVFLTKTLMLSKIYRL